MARPEKKRGRGRPQKEPRAYVYESRIRYATKGGEERESVGWIAAIRSAENPRGKYLTRVSTQKEAEQVCAEYLKTGKMPERQKPGPKGTLVAKVAKRARATTRKERPAPKPRVTVEKKVHAVKEKPMAAPASTIAPAPAKSVDRIAMMKAIWRRLK